MKTVLIIKGLGLFLFFIKSFVLTYYEEIQ